MLNLVVVKYIVFPKGSIFIWMWGTIIMMQLVASIH